MNTTGLVTEYNCERDPNNDLRKMLKEIHPWADGSLIEDVLAGTDNNVWIASALLEEMVSSEENYKRCSDFKNEDLNPIAEENVLDGNDLLADKNMDLAELTSLLQEGLKSDNSEFHHESDTDLNSSGWTAFDLEQRRKMGLEPDASTDSFPSVSSSVSKNIQDVALLEMPFRSVLQNSVNLSSLNNHVNLSKNQLPVGSSITSMSTADLVTEYNCEGDPNNDLRKMLKEIYPWADGSLIEDVLAGTDNNVWIASALLEEMVSSEENYKRCSDFKNEDLNPMAEEGVLDGNDLLADRNMDLAELTSLLQEGLKCDNSEFHHESDTDLKILLNSSGRTAFDLEQRQKMGLEPDASTDSFPSVSSSVSKNIQDVALLEMPFRSVLQNSVNFSSLNNHVKLSKNQLPVGSSITSMSTADLVTEYNCEGDPNNDLHKMLKEIHPWADGSLIEDVLAGTDNNVWIASALLEEMVSSEENYKRCSDFKNEDLNPIAEENVLDGNDLLADRNMDLAELTSLLREGLKSDNSEFHHESDTDLNSSGRTAFDLEQRRKMGLEPDASTDSFPSVSSSVSKNIQDVALLEMPFRLLQNSVNFSSLNNHVNLSKNQLPVGSSITSMSTADLVTEYNCEGEPNNDLRKMLKEIYPWADGSLIEDVLAGADNNVCKASALLEEMVSSEENHKRCNDIKNKDLNPMAEEGVLDGNDLLADRNMDLAELTSLLQEGLKSDNSEFHHESDTDLKILLNSSGRTAFDLEHRQKMGLEPDASTVSFPSVSSSVSKNIQDVALLEMPFRSVLQNSVNFSSLNNHVNLSKNQLPVGSSITSMSTADLLTEYNCEGDPNNDLHKMLKEIHPWAAGSLIEDVLAGTDNNVCIASALLEDMVSSEEKYKRDSDLKKKDLNPITEEGVLDGNDLLADRNMDLAELTSLLQEGLKSDNSEFHNESDAYLKILLNSLNCSTIEPEWEEDDVYLVHRKEALKMMRLASSHSKAAKDAYLRGDHLSARKYSQKAREEWRVTKRLNEKAAKEILNIRNSKNDQWTLDLHGLHLAEAVTALQERLSKIESQVPNSQLLCTNGLKDKSRIVSYAPPLSANCFEIEKSGIQSQLSKPTSLQVITGRGNHSRGEPVLPAAIRSFLIGNGYRFEETRPGVISVRPKFRQQLRNL